MEGVCVRGCFPLTTFRKMFHTKRCTKGLRYRCLLFQCDTGMVFFGLWQSQVSNALSNSPEAPKSCQILLLESSLVEGHNPSLELGLASSRFSPSTGHRCCLRCSCFAVSGVWPQLLRNKLYFGLFYILFSWWVYLQARLCLFLSGCTFLQKSLF